MYQANPPTIGTFEQAQEWIGQESPEFVSVAPVELGAIRHYCELIEDENPAYRTETRSPLWHGVLAPPGMLPVWCAPPTWQPPGDEHGEPPIVQRRVPLPGSALLAMSVEIEPRLPVVVGDRLTYTERINLITPQSTSLGDGHKIEFQRQYRRQDGDTVGIERLTTFRYTPAPSPRRRAGRNQERPAQQEPGDVITPFRWDVSYLKCVLCASATRDFNPIHHDRDFARAHGAPDVFINAQTYYGLFGRLLYKWAGEGAFLRRLRIRMRAMNIPGDVLMVSGRVSRRGHTAQCPVADVGVTISNDRVGVTTTGTASVVWPRSSTALRSELGSGLLTPSDT